jgi:peptide/nickel transport system ATP-binding protein/oligopeptide transport system ATP-binding protein
LPEPVLQVEDLDVTFTTEAGRLRAVRGVSFALAPGEVLALVGESGCGKSATAQSLTGLNRTNRNTTIDGRVLLAGRELLSLPEGELRRIRGSQIAMVFQDPMTSLNPVRRIGDLIVEGLRAHEPISRKAAHARAVELLGDVGIAEPERRLDGFAHQLSGGMRQRVMIAMALACRPAVLVADEPTTALDVTIQEQILRLIRTLRDEHGTSVLLITHDLGVVAGLADRVAVMYAGRIVEQASTTAILTAPRHPYTAGLLASIPRVDRARVERLPSIPGQPPSLLLDDDGCAFRARCAHAHDRCAERPVLVEGLACWLGAEGAS